jgi:hypothetical protein
MIFRRGVDLATESNPLNWRRGLFRTWVLVSVAWIMAWTIYAILSGLAHALNTTGDFLAIPVVLFGPPIALLFCSLATRWAIRGFRYDQEPEQSTTKPTDNRIVQLGHRDTDD